MARKAELGEFEQLVLLAALGLREKAYAPSIARVLEERAEREMSRGTLYAALDRLEAAVDEYAGVIAGNAPLTVQAMKYISTQVLEDPDDRDLARCDEMVAACFASEDFKEGRRAFMEKRKAQFEGR